MTQKASIFSKSLFLSNWKRFFFLPVLYFLFLFMYVPVLLHFETMVRIDRYETDFFIDRIRSHIGVIATPPLIMVVALIMAVAVFSYLYVQKNTFMMHAFPVSRNCLFVTNVLSGLSMMIVPTILCAAICLPMIVPHGATLVGDLFSYLLMAILTTILFFGLAVFVVMCTGILAAVPVLYAILNFLYSGLVFMCSLLSEPFAFGANTFAYNSRDTLSPVITLTGAWENSINLSRHYPTGLEGEVSEEMETVMSHMGIFAVWALVGVIILIISAFIYNKKQTESVGSFLPMEWTRPVFRWGFSFCASSLFALFMWALIGIERPGASAIIYVLSFIIAGTFFFYAISMLIAKTFRVFKKAAFVECLAMVGVFCLVVLALYVDLFGVEKRIPKRDQVLRISVTGSYNTVVLEEKDFDEAMEIHRLIIENKDALQRESFAAMDSGQWNNVNYRINYDTKNGKGMSRDYYLCLPDENTFDIDAPTIKMIKERIEAFVCTPSMVTKMVFGGDENKIPESIYLSWDYLTEENGDDVWKSDDMSLFENKDKEEFIKAVIKDINEGNISAWAWYGAHDGNNFINVEFYYRDLENSPATLWRHVVITDKCKNTIRFLEDMGVEFRGWDK